jgi:hypothetical protein
MNPIELVHAAMRGDDLTARQWVKDAVKVGLDFGTVEKPEGLDVDEQAVAAALFELLAQRQGRRAPAWASRDHRATRPVYLSRKAATSAVVRRWCESDAPEPLRVRNVYALPDYLASVDLVSRQDS